MKNLCDEMTERIQNLEKHNQELINKLNKLEEERQQELMSYEKKLRIAELNFVEKEDTNVNSDRFPNGKRISRRA
jgi:cytoplasmic iron level regulating protein YaaA (DUF328/UPF0246 family)